MRWSRTHVPNGLLAFARRWCVLRLSGHPPRLSRVIYIGGSRERTHQISTAGILLQPNCRRQAATCALPRRNPAVTPTVSAAFLLLRRWPHRARNVLNKLCQSGIRCLKPCLSYTTHASFARDLRYTDVWCLCCILLARFFLWFLLAPWSRRPSRDRPWKIVRCTCGNWFRSSSYRCPTDKSTWFKYPDSWGRGVVTVNLRANGKFLQHSIDYYVLFFFYFYLRSNRI